MIPTLVKRKNKMMTIPVNSRYVLAPFVITVLVVLIGQQRVIASNIINDSNKHNNDRRKSFRMRQRSLLRGLASASASSFGPDATGGGGGGGPFYVVNQDANGSLYASISEAADMSGSVTSTCTMSNHHPAVITCPYGGSSLQINAVSLRDKHEIGYWDVNGKYHIIKADNVADKSMLKSSVLGQESSPMEAISSTTTGDASTAITAYHNETTADDDGTTTDGDDVTEKGDDSLSSTTEAPPSTTSQSLTDSIIHHPSMIITVVVVVALVLLFFFYCTCCCCIDDEEDDDDDDSDDEDEFDDGSHDKFHDDHTSVTRGLGGSVASLYDVDLSNNSEHNGTDDDDPEHIYATTTTTTTTTIAATTGTETTQNASSPTHAKEYND